MMTNYSCRTLGLLIVGALLVSLLASSGCESAAELSSPTAQRLQVLVNAYLEYAVAKGVGPANREQLVAHLENAPMFLMKEFNGQVGSDDSLLVSLRDGEPFMIQYGVGISVGSDADVIACERHGRDGMRLAGYSNGRVDWIDEVAARELMQDDTRSAAAERPGTSHASLLGTIYHARK